MVTHSDFHEFMCEFCAAQFKRKDKLMEHIKRTHLINTKNNNDKIKKPRKPRKNGSRKSRANCSTISKDNLENPEQVYY